MIDLIFKAIDELTEDEDELWVLKALVEAGPMKFREIQAWLRDYAIREHYMRISLNRLMDKGLARRIRHGVYGPHMKAVLLKAIDLLEKLEERE